MKQANNGRHVPIDKVDSGSDTDRVSTKSNSGGGKITCGDVTHVCRAGASGYRGQKISAVSALRP